MSCPAPCPRAPSSVRAPAITRAARGGREVVARERRESDRRRGTFAQDGGEGATQRGGAAVGQDHGARAVAFLQPRDERLARLYPSPLGNKRARARPQRRDADRRVDRRVPPPPRAPAPAPPGPRPPPRRHPA